MLEKNSRETAGTTRQKWRSGSGGWWWCRTRTHVRPLGQLVKEEKWVRGWEEGGGGDVGCWGDNSRETAGTARQRWKSGSGGVGELTHVRLLEQLVKGGKVGQGGIGELTQVRLLGQLVKGGEVGQGLSLIHI